MNTPAYPTTLRRALRLLALVLSPIIAAFNAKAAIAQKAYLKASNTDAGDGFGISVAISGNTLVVGAPHEDSLSTTGNQSNNGARDAGAAYVYVWDGAAWSQQAYLKASNAGMDDLFGDSVAISGETIVVGAPGEDSGATGVNGNENDNSASNSGAAYVFVRNGTAWSQQAYLKASNAGEFDRFGESAAISGDTLVVGAYLESSNATGINGNQNNNDLGSAGAVYVFTRSGNSWSQQAYLKASNTENDELFGVAVALAGDSLVVGAPFEDSSSTGVNGNQTNNGAARSGAAYVFVRSGTTWSQQAYLKASNSGTNDNFGDAVAISDNTILIGAPGEGSGDSGVDGNQSDNSATGSGAAYVFVRDVRIGRLPWRQVAYLKASNTDPGDNFGASVGISGGLLAVGAPQEDSNATGINGNAADNSKFWAGAVYTFSRTGPATNPVWSFQDYLKGAVNVSSGPFFGTLAMSGDLMVVAAPGEDSSATGVDGNPDGTEANDSGAAYAFGPGAPEIAVEHPAGRSLTDGAALAFDVGGVNPLSRTFLVRNTGEVALTGLGITLDGADAARFSVTTGPAAAVPPGGSTTFTVQFSPVGSEPATGGLHLASNDPDENPFDLTLSGRSLSFDEDTDGDGFSDGAEAQLAALGFDWQVEQTELTETLLSNGIHAGLFTRAQLHALSVESPLIARDPASGLFTLTIGLRKSSDLLNFGAFPLAPGQAAITPSGELELRFSDTGRAAFFRLESR